MPPAARYDDPKVLARLAALKDAPISDLKQQWRELFQSEPPPFNRAFLESRLAYRIQELRWGGLKPETLSRLRALAEQLGDDHSSGRRGRGRGGDRPIAGTRLVREWQGVEHVVTVTADGFEWQGRPYRSLSAIARVITQVRWNGPLFFGLRSQRGAAR
ncbi:DUF2924 domain-containing protein [Mesorhizobium sp. IMUNJ23232]